MSAYNLPDGCTEADVDAATGSGPACGECGNWVDSCCDCGVCGIEMEEAMPGPAEPREVMLWAMDHMRDGQAPACPRFE